MAVSLKEAMTIQFTLYTIQFTQMYINCIYIHKYGSMHNAHKYIPNGCSFITTVTRRIFGFHKMLTQTCYY